MVVPASITTSSPAPILRSLARACGRRARRARADDRLEREAVPAFLVEELREIPGDLALGAPDERHLGQPLEDAIRDLAGAAERVELALVLHGAELLDEAVGRDGLRLSLLQRLVARVGDRIRLEADAAREGLRELADQVALRLDDLDAVDCARSLEIAKVGEEPDAVAVDDERGVRAVEADEVDDVHRVRDEQRLLELFLQTCKAIVHAFSFRYSRPRR